MKEYALNGNANSVALNANNTVGVMASHHFRTNQTRKTKFTASQLVEWAEAVEHAYGRNAPVELVFTPEAPLVAQAVDHKKDEEPKVGVAVSPRLETEASHE